MNKKELFLGAALGLAAAAAVLGTGRIVYGWDAGDSAEYALSHALMGLIGPWSLLAGACVLLLLIPRSAKTYGVSAVLAPAPLVAVILFEVCRFPSSHNLIPFELAALAMGSVALHLPSLLVSLLTKRTAAGGS